MSIDKNRLIELNILQDIYTSTIDNEGLEGFKLIKKDTIIKQLVFKEDIKSIKEEISKSGKPYKTRCSVLVNGCEPLLVKGNYNKLKEEIFINPNQNIGFKFY